jgi:transcriptional regulator with XRE-family HTH domain
MLKGEVREMHTVGTAIRRLRQRQNLTQDALAERLHVTRQAVSSWEMGRTQPDVGTLAALAAALGTDVNELIYGRSAEAAYADGRRFRIAVAAACGAAALAWLAAEGLMRPLLQTWAGRYVRAPLLW